MGALGVATYSVLLALHLLQKKHARIGLGFEALLVAVIVSHVYLIANLLSLRIVCVPCVLACSVALVIGLLHARNMSSSWVPKGIGVALALVAIVSLGHLSMPAAYRPAWMSHISASYFPGRPTAVVIAVLDRGTLARQRFEDSTMPVLKARYGSRVNTHVFDSSEVTPRCELPTYVIAWDSDDYVAVTERLATYDIVRFLDRVYSEEATSKAQ